MRKTKIICTIGPASDNEETLSKMCEAGMNVARLNFSHGTHEQHQAKIDLIKRCRFFVMPSIYESYGFAAMEMMAYGKPLVCTDVDGLPSTVGEGGLFVPPKDPKALAEAMNRMLSDDDLRRELGRKARVESEKRTVKATVDKIEEVYRSVLNQ